MSPDRLVPGVYGFFGDFRFLSNFELCDVTLDGEVYPSVEAAYQAAKTHDSDHRAKFREDPQGDTMRAGKRARKLGRQREMRPDWEQVKFDVMRSLVLEKFARNDRLKQALLLTGDLYLEETNGWGDTYWGVCKGVGQNNLGRILMEVRDFVRNSSSDIVGGE